MKALLPVYAGRVKCIFTDDDSREKKQVGDQWEMSSSGSCLFLFAVAEDEDGRAVSRQIADKIG